jgi:hypothetical protein
VCKYDGCKFLHTTEYLAMKEPDIGEHREIKMENPCFYQIRIRKFFGLPDPSLFVRIRIRHYL